MLKDGAAGSSNQQRKIIALSSQPSTCLALILDFYINIISLLFTPRQIITLLNPMIKHHLTRIPDPPKRRHKTNNACLTTRLSIISTNLKNKNIIIIAAFSSAMHRSIFRRQGRLILAFIATALLAQASAQTGGSTASTSKGTRVPHYLLFIVTHCKKKKHDVTTEPFVSSARFFTIRDAM